MSSSSDDSSSSEDEKPVLKRRRYESEDEDGGIARPAFGMGMSFNPGGFVTSTTEVPKPAAAASAAATTNKMSMPRHNHNEMYGVGAALMSKMGYKAGTGLGQDGRGIVNPVEQKLRPTKLGVGGINEKVGTKKDRKEEKKVEYERREKERKVKDIYKTLHELRDEGMMDNDVFQVIDKTSGGKLVDLSTLYIDNKAGLGSTVEFDKARAELQNSVDEWEMIKAQRKLIEEQIAGAEKQLDGMNVKEAKLQEILDDLKREPDVDKMLELIQGKYVDEIESLQLDEIAVAALRPQFEQEIKTWDPLLDSGKFKTRFLALKRLLRVDADNSSFHALLYQVWLPHVQSKLMKEWVVTEPYMLLGLIQDWRPLLSNPIRSALYSRVIIPKLKTQIDQWQPHAAQGSIPAPHQWLFPWLEHFDPPSRDLLVELVKNKFANLLRTWHPGDEELISDLAAWKELFGAADTDKLLNQNLVPMLSQYLRRNFNINPANQDVTALDNVLKWRHYLSSASLGVLLDQQFFSKWLEVLRLWLIACRSYDQLADWVQHWYEKYFPADVLEIVQVSQGFKRGFDLINNALDLEPDKRESLSLDSNGAPVKKKFSAGVKREATFKVVVENYCEDNGFVVRQLDDFDDKHGQKLMRISASASGKGGVRAFIYKDVLYVQKLKRDQFRAIKLEELEDLLS